VRCGEHESAERRRTQKSAGYCRRKRKFTPSPTVPLQGGGRGLFPSPLEGEGKGGG
jgi:hypothetical protein